MTIHAAATDHTEGAKSGNRYRSSLSSGGPPPPPQRPKNCRVNREFHSSKYSTRHIALKFAYLGQRYNGLEYTRNTTPLPTIEEELWKALNKAHLVFPIPNPLLPDDEINWEGCDYSKSGRTDKGVSAFGQVIGIRVRSNRPVNRIKSEVPGATDQDGERKDDVELASLPLELGGTEDSSPFSLANSWSEESLSFDPINDEIPYPQMLNRLLPPDIRVLAWCPSPPTDFSARFSCKERRYRYFFTNPAFTPTHDSAGPANRTTFMTASGKRKREGWLDIEAMREGAKKFMGFHDFRNFCKLDASKQIENFKREIFHADIEEVDPRTGPAGYVGLPGFEEYEFSNQCMSEGDTGVKYGPRVFTITLHGSAFLWHQVRHMVSILFLIGQGLESPDLVDRLLDVKVTSGKPMYEMADDAPLVLWDSIFPREGSNSREDALEWVYVGTSRGRENGVAVAPGGKGNGRYGSGGVVDDLWKVWRQKKMDEVLAGSLLNCVVEQGSDRSGETAPASNGDTSKPEMTSLSQKIFQGGNCHRFVGKYTPMLQKPRQESVEDVNARWVKRKGFEQREEMKERGYRTIRDDPSDYDIEQSQGCI